ncbi:hypothetical protein J6590_106928 [Homalodisca vitripennis]|nr:hypothetical protein J6590_106928 [Homalodisca vitripennis]
METVINIKKEKDDEIQWPLPIISKEEIDYSNSLKREIKEEEHDLKNSIVKQERNSNNSNQGGTFKGEEAYKNGNVHTVREEGNLVDTAKNIEAFEVRRKENIENNFTAVKIELENEDAQISLETMIGSIIVDDAEEIASHENNSQKAVKRNPMENFPFRCRNCVYGTTVEKNLICHMKYFCKSKGNPIEKLPFKCNDCSYATSLKKNLVSHMKKHIGPPRFQCIICDYSAKQKKSLRMHLLTHAGQRPLKCDTCDYSTVNRQLLQQHVLLHQGKRPYQCKLCAYSSNFNSALRAHMFTHSD